MIKNITEYENDIRGGSAQILNKCVDFIELIGIKTSYYELPASTFLPGLSIENGSIVIDMQKLKYPGDILHEAGHIAVVPTAERSSLTAKAIERRENNEAEEMMAIAWSYAACIQLDIDPYFVFHDGGYKAGGAYIAEAFGNKKYFGLPMLQWIGLTADEKNAKILGVKPYPYMIKWLCD